MIDNFIQAKCHEWVLLASLMLKKFTVINEIITTIIELITTTLMLKKFTIINEIIDHVRFGKYPIVIATSIKNGLKELESWSEHEW